MGTNCPRSAGRKTSEVASSARHTARPRRRGWLADNKASTFGYQTASYAEWLGMITGPGRAFTGAMVNGEVVSGVAVLMAEGKKKLATQWVRQGVDLRICSGMPTLRQPCGMSTFPRIMPSSGFGSSAIRIGTLERAKSGRRL